MKINCDIFCNVIDNYGDIGVCWRLARQLANEHGMVVRLWVDDLASFRKLCPEINPQLFTQQSRGVEVRHWTVAFPEVEPAQLVIEAFACELPERYVAAMAAQTHKAVWINLEYLSAEEWVAGCHGLPSPHPTLPLVKYFFFPGFTPQTGGLLLERDLLARRDAFQRDPQAIAAFWQALGVPPSQPDEVRVSLFCYENPALPVLFETWAEGSTPLLCLVPEGRVLPQVATFFGHEQVVAGDILRCGMLEVRVLPFVEQERYDELLWACDCNFVRGEDSCVRAQWAGQPFIWHIYPQHDNVHMQKLRALMALYCADLPPDAASALHALWESWNPLVNSGQTGSTRPLVLSAVEGSGQATSSVNSTFGLPDSGLPTFGTGSGQATSTGSGQATSTGSGQATSTGSGQAWNDFWMHRSVLRAHARAWAQQLSGNSLALNLLDFFQKIDRMRGLQN